MGKVLKNNVRCRLRADLRFVTVYHISCICHSNFIISCGKAVKLQVSWRLCRFLVSPCHQSMGAGCCASSDDAVPLWRRRLIKDQWNDDINTILDSVHDDSDSDQDYRRNTNCSPSLRTSRLFDVTAAEHTNGVFENSPDPADASCITNLSLRSSICLSSVSRVSFTNTSGDESRISQVLKDRSYRSSWKFKSNRPTVTAFYEALQNGEDSIVRTFLEEMPDSDRLNVLSNDVQNGDDCLMVAVRQRHYSIIRYLMEQGATVSFS